MSDYVTLTYKIKPRDKLRLDQAFKRLKDKGCVRSRREMVVKLAYFVLLGDIERLCEVVGQSEFELERRVESGGSNTNTNTNTTTNTNTKRR